MAETYRNGQATEQETDALQIKLLGGIDAKPFRLEASLMGNQTVLNGFYLFISQECNLACTYCYGDGGEYRKGKMNMDEATARNFVDKFLIGESPQYLINFFGGEPFLNFSLMRLVVDLAKEKARRLGFRVAFKVTTNGTVWSDRIKQFVDEEIDSLTVSLDGPKDLNDAQRPPLGRFSSYEKTLGTLEDLRNSKPNGYTIRTIITRESAGRLDEIYRHNSELAPPGGVGLTVVDAAPDHALALSEEDHQAVIDDQEQAAAAA